MNKKLKSLLLALVMAVNLLVPLTNPMVSHAEGTTSQPTTTTSTTSGEESKNSEPNTILPTLNTNTTNTQVENPVETDKTPPASITEPQESSNPVLSTQPSTQPVETKPIVTTPISTAPVATKPTETTPVETKPVATKPAVDSSIAAPSKNAMTPMALADINFTKSGDNVPLYTTQNQYGDINLSGDNLTSDLIGAYIEITVPNIYLEKITVPPANMITLVKPVVNNGDGTSTIRVNLADINSTTTAGFPFIVKFLDRVTPEGYSITPKITLFNSDGTVIKEATGNLTMTTKNDKPNFFKYIITNQNENNKNNNIGVYGGVLNAAGTHIGTTGSDISFQYKMQTEVDRDPYSYGDGLRRTRVPETIVVKDTLPTYINAQGQTVRAYFDPAKNPGWTLDAATGVVTYTVNSSSAEFYSGGAGKDLVNVKLILSFPGAPINKVITNNAQVTVTPYNLQSYEEVQVASDGIDFLLIGSPMGAGAFVKSNNDASQLILDPGANHLVFNSYIPSFTNRSLYPVSDIVITDGPFDPRYYMKSLDINTSPNNIQAIYGVKPDGTKVPLTFIVDPANANKTLVQEIDGQAIADINTMVSQVRSGQIAAADTVPVVTNYTKLEIVMKPTYQLLPGQVLSPFIRLYLNDPYHTTPFEPATNPKNTFNNTASLTSNILFPDGQTVPYNATASSAARMRLKAETISMTKSTDPNTGTLGSSVTFRLQVNLNGLSKSRNLTNPKIIDLLPQGLTYSGYSTVGNYVKKVDVIENYLGSGRTAVIYYFNDQVLMDTGTTSFFIHMSTKVNNLAVPAPLITEDLNNINYAWFTADEFKTTPTNVTISTPLADKWDVDQDGIFGEPMVGAQSFFTPVLPTEVKSTKYIRKPGGTWVSSGVQTNYGETYEYKLSTVNFDKNPINSFVLYDRLPTFSDGEWDIITGPVTGPSGFTIWYLEGPDAAPLDPKVGVSSPGWTLTPSDFYNVTAIKITMDQGRVIAPGETIDFIIPSKSPDFINGIIDAEKIKNSFYTSRDGGQNYGQTNAVFNQMPISVKVEKKWSGIPLDSINVELYRKSNPTVVLGTMTLNTANQFKGIFYSQPPIDVNGVDITDYAVREVTAGVPNFDYSVEITGNQKTGYIITNTKKLIDISGRKTWDDANNQDGIRPTSITVHLKEGTTILETKTVDATTNWSYTFNGYPEFRNGIKINYTISEDPVTGYETVYDGFNITNKHTPELIDISGTKTWDDANNQDGIRPDSITVHLMDGYTRVDSIITTKDTNYTYTFKQVPKFRSGQVIEYTVSEEPIAGYVPTYSGMDIKNTHIPEVITIKGNKIWDDAENQDGKRPASITINLHKNGDSNNYSTITVDNTTAWNFEFMDVPKYEDGKEIVWSITEDPVQEYTTSINGTTVTNKYIPELTSVPVNKIWNDANNQDGVRPTSLTYNLHSDVTSEIVQSATVTAADGWMYEFKNLPKYSNGNLIDYTVVEVPIVHYGTEITKSSTGVTVTNTNTPGLTSFIALKKWDDGNNQDGIRPTEVTFQLLKNGVPFGDPVIVNKDNGGEYIWTNLPLNDAGVKVVYSVEEITPSGGYEVSYDTSTEGIVVVTNKHTPIVTEISGVKTWDDADNQDGIRPTSLTINVSDETGIVKSQVITPVDGVWKYSFTNLPKYRAGVEIVYTVSEEQIPGYEPTIIGNDIVNKHVPELTSVSGYKIWNDEYNQDGKRPNSITINLHKNGDPNSYKTLTVDGTTGWGYEFTNLPKYENGKEISWTISEEEVDGYTTTVEVTTVTNRHIPEVITVSGIKTWDDGNNQDGIRPASITVNVSDDLGIVQSQEVTPVDGVWSYTFKDLPKYRNGVEIVYTVSEDLVKGYETTITGYDITNKHVPELTKVSGYKTWDDANNQDGIRPSSITINLHKNGETNSYKTLTVDNTTAWTFEFSDVPKFENGKEIVWTITEDQVEGYTTSIEGTAVTNKHIPELTSIPVEKIWNDANNQDGGRPSIVVINLYSDATQEIVQTGTLTAANNWKYEFKDLPKYFDGTLINYSVVEVPVENYSVDVVNSVTGATIINTQTPGLTSFIAMKKWDDGNNQDGIRPSEVVFQLLKNNVPLGKPITISEGSGWQHIWNNLPLNDAGIKVVYSVEEITPSGGYTVNYDNTTDGIIVVSNKHIPIVTEVKGVKTWEDADDQDGIRPKSITVHVSDTSGIVKSQVVTPTNGVWSYTFSDLPKYKNGVEIVYTVSEDPVESYETTIKGYDITNKHVPENTSLTGEKIWDDGNNQDGIRPSEVTFQLLKNGNIYGDPVIVSEGTDWKYTWNNLPKNEAGVKAVYSIKELTPSSGYTVEYDNTTEGKITVTNKHTPIMANITGVKTWDDADNQDGIRASSITVNVSDKTGVVRSLVVKPVNGIWSYTFNDLPKFKDGVEIVYTVSEVPVTGYESKVTGYDITNKHIPETTSVTGEKIWIDADNQDGIRPSSVTINLHKNGDPQSYKSLVVDSSSAWKYEFKDLPKYENGKEIAWTLTENPIDGYTATNDGRNITNKHITEVISIPVIKIWDDGNNQDGVRPESITLNLFSNVSKDLIKTATVTSKEDWKYVFNSLPKYHKGMEIEYSVVEAPVENYAVTMVKTKTGIQVTNKYTPGLTSFVARKAWDDADNQDGIRPSIVLLQLLSNGKPFGSPVELTKDSKWEYTWNNLPIKENGKPVKYSVEEIAPSGGYSVTYDYSIMGTAMVINKHVPIKTEVSGLKIWDDSNNQDKLRPKSINVNLHKNGSPEIFKTLTLDQSTDWKYSFKDLPKYENGKEIVWTVTEDKVDGYTVAIDGTTIINTHVPKEPVNQDSTNISGKKIWIDNDDALKKRPSRITINLLADGVKVSSLETTAENGWSFVFTDMPKLKNGKVINYTITEDKVTGYTTRIEGTTVTNTIIKGSILPNTGSISNNILVNSGFALLLIGLFLVKSKKRKNQN